VSPRLFVSLDRSLSLGKFGTRRPKDEGPPSPKRRHLKAKAKRCQRGRELTQETKSKAKECQNKSDYAVKFGVGAPAEPHPKEKEKKKTGHPRPKRNRRAAAKATHLPERLQVGRGQKPPGRPQETRRGGGAGRAGGGHGGWGIVWATWMHLHYLLCCQALLLLLLLLLRWLLLLLQLLPSLLPRLQCLRSTGRHKLPSLRRPGRVWRLNHPTC